MKNLKIALLIFCCMAGAMPLLALEQYETDVREILPGFANYGKRSGSEAALLDKNGRQVGKLLLAPAKYKRQEGYNGFINVAVVLDNKGKICGVALGSNKETPRWVRRFRKGGILKRWNGKTVAAAAGMKVDGVTGATWSSNAIKAEVQAILQANLKR